MYLDPSVLAELPPEVLAMVAAEHGGSIPGYQHQQQPYAHLDSVHHYQDDINEAII